MQNSSLNRILKENEVYEYNWQFNLSKGAMPFLEVEKNIQQQVENLARKAAEKVNVQFASIDVIELESGTDSYFVNNSSIFSKSSSFVIAIISSTSPAIEFFMLFSLNAFLNIKKSFL